MKHLKRILFLLSFGVISILFSCSSDDNYVDVPTSPVVVDLTQVPYPKLSDYKFFEGELKNIFLELDFLTREDIMIAPEYSNGARDPQTKTLLKKNNV